MKVYGFVFIPKVFSVGIISIILPKLGFWDLKEHD